MQLPPNHCMLVFNGVHGNWRTRASEVNAEFNTAFTIRVLDPGDPGNRYNPIRDLYVTEED